MRGITRTGALPAWLLAAGNIAALAALSVLTAPGAQAHDDDEFTLS
jgi:hypothetical protein